jgi:4-oxalocrotonate tautomerase
MPLVRIDVSKTASSSLVRIIGEAVYDAMTALAGVPVNDRFQIITRHERDDLVYPADGYLGITYSNDIVFIQVTWVGGRSTEVKKAFYKTVADTIAEKGGIRHQDVVISLIDSGREDWSFGNGEMQYAPP